jgi:hypothetical protein
MASFLVLAHSRQGQRDDDSTVFIRDGFSALAFILPVPWLLVQRLWFEAALIFALTLGISMAGALTGYENTAVVVTLLLSILVGFEANNWRAAALERRGFEQLAVVDARNADDAETVWFFRQDFTESVPSTGVKSDAAVLPTARKPAPQRATGGMVGLVSLRGEN